MSTEILQLRVWLENTQQNHIPANDNSLRLEALLRPCLGVANDEAGGDTDGDVWVVGDTPVGAFATFSKDDIAIHKQGNWHAWAPVEGLRLVVNDVRKVFDGSAWIDDPSISGGGAVDSVNGQTGIVVLDLDDLGDVDAASPTNGYSLTWNSTSNKWEPAAPSGGLSNPMTTAGDIIVGGASGTPTRLAAGATAGHVLTSNGAGVAPSYQAPGGGGASNACVWGSVNSSLSARRAIMTNSGLTMLDTVSGVAGHNKATVAKSSGKRYFEVLVDAIGAAGTPTIGVAQMASSGQVGSDATVNSNRTASWGLLANSGDKYSGSPGSYGSALSPGDVVMVAVDFAAGKIWWGKNGTWFASGDPAAGTNEAFSNLADWLYPAVSGGSGSNVTANFGASAFAHTPPSGFSAWDT